ncbi:hypothetical protein ACRAWF_15165 [Streptomyces sp. L7]
MPPIPVGYGTAAYWAIHAFVWTDAAGNRSRCATAGSRGQPRGTDRRGGGADRPDEYLTEELHQRLGQGPVAFTLQVQPAEEDDPTHDPALARPEQRKEITAGRLEIAGPVDDQDHRGRAAFDPTRVTAGIELSDDPVLTFRAGAYAESYRRRSRESR